jgi:hypothetical protein
MSSAKVHFNLPNSQNKVVYLEDLESVLPTFSLPDASAARKRRKSETDIINKRPKKVARSTGQVSLFQKPFDVSKVPADLESVFLSAEQKAVCELASEGYSVFFTGSAGLML